MSGFLVCWHRDGGRLSESAIARAGARLRHRGPEGLTRRDGEGVVALHAAFTSAIGAEDGLPVSLDGWLIAGDLRLDARSRLRARLGGRESIPEGLGDAALLAIAVRRWGDRTASHLIGDFAFAAIDVTDGTLIAARGTLGVKGLYYAEGPGFVACSNDLDALLAMPGVDDRAEDRAMVEMIRDGLLTTPGLTARRGVARVAAGWQRVWRRRGPGRDERHWRFPVPQRLRLWRDEEYLEQFHELLEEAVADRVRTPRAGILLSGGLDSSAIASSARTRLRSLELRALTVSSDRIVENDEHRWAVRVADHLGIPIETAWTEEDAPLAHCDVPSLRTAEPVAEPELLAWRARAATLAAFGPVVLYGEDGDALFAPPGLLTMLRTLRWRETWRAWRAYHAAEGVRPWIGLREQRVARGAPPPTWLRSTISADTVDTHPTRLGRSEASHPLRPRAVARLSAPDWESFFAEDDPATTGVPTTFALPLLDPRVIEFVFAIPPIPWAQRKHLLRRAYRGRLPDDVLRRPKTPVAGYHEAAVAQWRARGGAERPLRTPMDQWIDVDAWRDTLRREPDADRVMEAWRVFEVARWLAQPSPDT